MTPGLLAELEDYVRDWFEGCPDAAAQVPVRERDQVAEAMAQAAAALFDLFVATGGQVTVRVEERADG